MSNPTTTASFAKATDAKGEWTKENMAGKWSRGKDWIMAEHNASLAVRQQHINNLDKALDDERNVKTERNELALVVEEWKEKVEDLQRQLSAEQEKLRAAVMLLRHAKDSISTEDHVRMGLVLVKIRDSEIAEIAAIWKESET